ncbi:MAG: hypothetical protein RL097_418 [Candidatus Parcubacteria bacterium]|jgi:hypothetical protein
MQNLEDNKLTFQNEHSWMVQLLTLAMVGALAYLQLAPMIV